ncbi:MAG TPA: AI-2E family transporter [Polyangia bacterium]|nr:AI-2E family transporter [Polyangia bacterium]
MSALDNEVRPSQVTLKTVFTVAFGVLVVIALVEAVRNAMLAVALTGAALLIAVALDHPVRILERRGLKRPLAIAIVTLAGIGLIVGFGFTLIPPAIEQGKQLVHDAPQFVRSARSSALFRTLDARFHLGDYVVEGERRLPEMLEGAATPILNALGNLLSGVAAAITIAFLMVFMLIFGGRVINAIVAEARPEHRATYEDVLHKIYRSIGGYLGGLTLVCMTNATLTTTFLAIDSVPFFLPLGIVAGASSMIPYAGPIVAGTGISLIALFTKGIGHGVASAIYFIVYGLLEGNVFAPLIFRRTVHVNPLIVTLSILFFGEIAGIMGAIIAVPVVATLQIILREVLRIRRERLNLAREAS